MTELYVHTTKWAGQWSYWIRVPLVGRRPWIRRGRVW